MLKSNDKIVFGRMDATANDVPYMFPQLKVKHPPPPLTFPGIGVNDSVPDCCRGGVGFEFSRHHALLDTLLCPSRDTIVRVWRNTSAHKQEQLITMHS